MIHALKKLSNALKELNVDQPNLNKLITFASREVALNLVTKGPFEFLKKYGPVLENLDESDSKIFEKALSMACTMNYNTYFTEWEEIIDPIFKKYPEYLNLNIIKPIKLIENLFVPFDDNIFLTYSEPIYIEAFQSLDKNEINNNETDNNKTDNNEKETIAQMFSSMNQYIDTLIKTFPNFSDLIYLYITNNSPELYFIFNLNEKFKYNDREEVAYNLFIKSPDMFLNSNLQDEFPNFDGLEPERSVKSTEQRAVEAILIPPSSPQKIETYITKKYYTTYPSTKQKFIHLILSYSELLTWLIGVLYGIDVKDNNLLELIEDISDELIQTNKGIRVFYENAMESLLPRSYGFTLAKSLLETNKKLFNFLQLNRTYPELSIKIGDHVRTYEARSGVIIDLDYKFHTATLKLDKQNIEKPMSEAQYEGETVYFMENTTDGNAFVYLGGIKTIVPKKDLIFSEIISVNFSDIIIND